MIYRAILAAWLLVAAVPAFADQAAWVPREDAEKARALIAEGADIRHYCALCGDKAYRQESVEFNEILETETQGKFELYVNGSPIDLAYVYVQKEGKWSNLAMLCGLAVDSVPEVLPADLPAAQPDFDRMQYIGTLDGRMLIVAELSKHAGEIHGAYFYSHVGTLLLLSGEVDQLGAFTLNETDLEGKSTGIFNGKLSEKGALAEGAWSSPDGAKKLDFKLKRIALFGEENGSIIAGSQGTEIHADFPVFVAAFGPAYTAVNESIQSFVQKRMGEYSAEFAATAAELGFDEPRMMDEGLGQTISVGEHQIRFANERVVSVMFRVSLFQGGAHGITLSAPVNLRIEKQGEAYKANPIAIGGLLKPGAAPVTALSDYLIAALKKQEASSVLSGDVKGFKPEEMGAFTLSPRGITVYFDPYAVGSYAEGSFEVFVPFAALPDAFEASAIAGIAEEPPTAPK